MLLPIQLKNAKTLQRFADIYNSLTFLYIFSELYHVENLLITVWITCSFIH